MEVITIPYGPLVSNMYLIKTCSGTFLIDPSVYPEDIKLAIPQSINAIICTHGHFDHINAVDKWSAVFPEAHVFIHNDDKSCFNEPFYNCSSYFSEKCIYKTKPEDIKLLNEYGFIVVETPGHSPGSVCIYYEENGKSVMFTGDTLFKLGIGRADLPGGSEKMLISSLSKLSNFDLATVIYPGHGPSSTLQFELSNNP